MNPSSTGKPIPKKASQGGRTCFNFICALVIMNYALQLQASEEFTCAQTFFDACDYAGHAQLTINLSNTLALPTGESLDCSIIFSSNIAAPPSKILGSGWSFPLMESRLSQDSERSFLLQAPGGRNISLTKSIEGDGYVSGDTRWVGTIKDAQTFLVKGPSDWQLIYKNGRLRTASKDKIILEWNVQDHTQVLQMKQSVVTDLVRVETGETQGVPSSLWVSGLGDVRMTFSKMPHLKKFQGGAILTGFSVALGAMQYPDGSSRNFDYGCDLPSDQSSINMATQGKCYMLPLRTLSWIGSSGLITQSDRSKYVVEPVRDIELANITRIDETGSKLMYQVDPVDMTIKKTLGNGEATVEHLFTTKGPLYQKVRKIERFHAEASQPFSTSRKWYDASGNSLP